MQQRTFSDEMLNRPQPGLIDVETTLAHFAVITYLIDPDVARQLLHPRFQLVTVMRDGREFGLLSVVPFVDQDFRFRFCPWLKWQFGQTNYRVYVRDQKTDELAVWFLGTSLDSWTVSIPRHCWKLPWHRARIEFDCEYNSTEQRYEHYRMKTTNSWADAQVELSDTGKPVTELDGFPDAETGLVVLTHPLKGYYFRRDGRLGSYSIWHDRLQMTVGQVQSAHFALLDQMQLVQSSDLDQVHSVLLQPTTEFTIYLPPRPVEGDLSDKAAAVQRW